MASSKNETVRPARSWESAWFSPRSSSLHTSHGHTLQLLQAEKNYSHALALGTHSPASQITQTAPDHMISLSTLFPKGAILLAEKNCAVATIKCYDETSVHKDHPRKGLTSIADYYIRVAGLRNHKLTAPQIRVHTVHKCYTELKVVETSQQQLVGRDHLTFWVPSALFCNVKNIL